MDLFAATNGGGAGAGVALVLVFFLIVGAYFLPLIVAAVRHVPNIGSVAVVNVFLGWTFIGWVVALAMACRSSVTPHQVNVYGQPPGYGPSPYGQPGPGSAGPYGSHLAPPQQRADQPEHPDQA